MVRNGFLCLIALFDLGLVGCESSNRLARAEKQVVVYTSVDDVFARPICERFERETGIKVLLVPDTEEVKSSGLLNRLIAEQSRPRCDVFWSGDPIRAAILKSKDISAPYHSPQSEGLAKLYSDADGHWTGFSCRARVLIYNRDLVPKGQEPKSVRDLVDSQGCRFYPIAALLVLQRWASLSGSWAQAAELHGVPSATYLWQVILPFMRPALVAAVLLIGLLSTADVGSILLLHPPGQGTLPLAIFTVMANAPEALVSSLCVVYVALAVGIVVLFLSIRKWICRE